jgi:tetratricopeptide (TPR) repeat protein
MNLNRILQFSILLSLACSAFAIAQASDPTTDGAENDEAITLLDKTVPVADAGPPEEDPEPDGIDDRELLLAEFAQYKEMRDGGALDQAENIAKRIIELSIRISGPTSNDTAMALNNLAVVQHQTKDYEASQQNFSAAIEIIEDNEDQLNKGLINPLRGLGASQLESGRPDLATRSFGRAVHISHVNEGPHNLEQVEILEALAETHLRLGSMEEAKKNQDLIYALNLRHYAGNAMAMVPSLLRRASWQRRTGYILDERATYRRIIRIIESVNGKDHLTLIQPLMKLGESYFFVDTSESSSYQSAVANSGETYFKRAVRIAAESPDADWMTLATAKIALGDFYNFRSEINRARSNYRDAWELMSVEEDRLDTRKSVLEVLTPLNGDTIPRFAGDASSADRRPDDNNLREGRIVVSYDVDSRGRVSALKIIEANPVEFDDMRRSIQHELRTRIYRPKFENAEPVDSPNQMLSHVFYYRQDELDELRKESGATAPQPEEEPDQT